MGLRFVVFGNLLLYKLWASNCTLSFGMGGIVLGNCEKIKCPTIKQNISWGPKRMFVHCMIFQNLIRGIRFIN